MGDVEAAPVDPGSLIRSRQYRVLLVLAAMIGVLVSLASWSFLALVHEIQVGVYEDLPGELGYDTVPWWWPLPWLALAGVLTALAILRLPGHGGHVPADGLKTGGGPTQPIELPGVLLAALATLGLGLVLGPEGPLIALGMGLAVLAVRLVRKDAPQQVLGLMAAAGSFAAISTVFGSPVIGAVILLEAAALGGGGPTLSVVLLPGLIAAGLGSLVFIGMGDWTGLSTSAWALSPLDLPPYAGPDWGDFAWTIVLAIAAAVVVFVIVEIARLTTRLVSKQPFVLTVAAALVVGGLAIAFNQATDEPANAVLFSGEHAFESLFEDAPGLSLSALDAAPGVQGARLEHLPGQLSRRPDVPGLVPRHCRRTPRRRSTGILGNTRRRGPDGRGLRVDPEAPARISRGRPPSDLPSGTHGRPTHHRGRGRRLHHHRGACGTPRPTSGRHRDRARCLRPLRRMR